LPSSFRLSRIREALSNVVEPVAQVQHDIQPHHYGVQRVQEDHQVIVEDELVENPCRVTHEDDDEEEEALPRDGPRLQRFVDGNGPGGAKTDQHCNLENAHASLRVSCVRSAPWSAARTAAAERVTARRPGKPSASSISGSKPTSP